MKHVYCTDCWYFRLCDENIPYCVHENECNIDDCYDNKPITERPKYEEELKHGKKI